MNDVPEISYCHMCKRDTPTRLMCNSDRVVRNVCRVCRASRKGRPNVPYIYYEEYARTHPLTDAEKNFVTGREKRQLAYYAKMDRTSNEGRIP